jgi:hypothetical protein
MSTLRVNTITPQSGSLNQLSGSLLVTNALTVSGASAFVNATFTQLLTGTTFSGSAATFSGNVTAATLTGTLSTAAQTNITSVGTLSSLTVSGDLTVDTSTLKVDSANNRVGIGTATPTAGYALDVFSATDYVGATIRNSGHSLLSIQSAASARQALAEFKSASRTYTIGLQTDNTFSLYDNTAAATRLSLDTSGNLAVTTGGLTVNGSATGYSGGELRLGSTSSNIDSAISTQGGGSPIMYFDHRGTSNVGLFRWRNGTGGATTLMTLGATGDLSLPGASPVIEISDGVYSVGDLVGTLKFRGYTTGYEGAIRSYIPSGSPGVDYQDLRFYTSAGPSAIGVERVRIDASGNLGVGVTSMADSGHIYLAAGKALRFSSTAYITPENNTTGAEISTGGVITFKTGSGPTERARITSGGYFKASNDGAYVGSTGSYHELRSTSSDTNAVELTNASASPYGLSINFTAASPDNNTNRFFSCGDSTTARMYVYSDGDLANHDGVYGTISDERLKQDIVDAGSAWNDMKAVRFRKYRMKTDVEANPDAPAMLGVIAQELEQVMPGLVDEHPDMAQVEVPVLDEDGNETGEFTTEQRPTGTSTKTVKSSILLMKAAVALQEAMARIEALEARLEALEA